jgi:DNA-binding NarL/FixJ family response regulator
MVKILIADDHPIFRKGIRTILSETPGFVVAGEASTSAEVISKVQKEKFDIILLDLSMPGRGGLETLKDLKRDYPDILVLVVSMHPEDQYAMRVLRAGAAGYLTKEHAPDELVTAIRKIARGGKYITPTLAEKMAFDLERASDGPPHESLSDREYQVMLLISSGKSIKDIGEDLFLSDKTISTYRARILEKMNMKSNAELIRYAIQNKLVD